MKIHCPACGNPWPGEYKFCPADGTDLDALRAQIQNAQGDAQADAPEAPEEPEAAPAEESAAPVEESAAPAVPTEPAAPAPQSEAPTRMESAKPRTRPQRRERPQRHPARTEGTAREGGSASIDPEKMAQVAAQAQQAQQAVQESEAVEEAAPQPLSNPPDSNFSETQWFMAGAEEDADLLEANPDEERYKRDASVSTKDRRRFSLRTNRKKKDSDS